MWDFLKFHYSDCWMRKRAVWKVFPFKSFLYTNVSGGVFLVWRCGDGAYICWVMSSAKVVPKQSTLPMGYPSVQNFWETFSTLKYCIACRFSTPVTFSFYGNEKTLFTGFFSFHVTFEVIAACDHHHTWGQQLNVEIQQTINSPLLNFFARKNFSCCYMLGYAGAQPENSAQCT